MARPDRPHPDPGREPAVVEPARQLDPDGARPRERPGGGGRDAGGGAGADRLVPPPGRGARRGGDGGRVRCFASGPRPSAKPSGRGSPGAPASATRRRSSGSSTCSPSSRPWWRRSSPSPRTRSASCGVLRLLKLARYTPALPLFAAVIRNESRAAPRDAPGRGGPPGPRGVHHVRPRARGAAQGLRQHPARHVVGDRDDRHGRLRRHVPDHAGRQGLRRAGDGDRHRGLRGAGGHPRHGLRERDPEA